MSELIALQQTLLAEESWASVWPDAAPLGRAHALEVDGGIEPRRVWDPDTELLALMNLQGSYRIYTAREQETKALLGYICWTVQLDPESRQLLIANMGPWYAAPGSRCGGLLFKYSMGELRKLGVQCLFPHHRLQGRGSDLGPFLQLLGAIPIQKDYLLWIGESNA